MNDGAPQANEPIEPNEPHEAGKPDEAAAAGGAGRSGHSRRTAVVLVVLAVACVAAGLTAILAGTGGGGNPPPRPGSAAAGQLPHHDMAAMPAPPGSAAPTGSGATPSPTRSGTLPASRPTRLDIASIGVHSALLDLGLNKDGTLEVPGKPLQAGWFHDSPAPGQSGPSVILGHVDSTQTGPAVFYRLGAMKPHQQIRVTRADHKVAVFTVDAVRTYEKKTFPTLDVYGNTPDAELRLITCSDWNARTHSYDGNTIVFAHLTP